MRAATRRRGSRGTSRSRLGRTRGAARSRAPPPSPPARVSRRSPTCRSTRRARATRSPRRVRAARRAPRSISRRGPRRSSPSPFSPSIPARAPPLRRPCASRFKTPSGTGSRRSRAGGPTSRWPSGTTPAAVGGVAAFAGRAINKVGTAYALTASATGPATGTSAAFNITAGTATQLVFSVQPSTTSAGAAITPAVQLTALDASNNTATGFTGNVTLAIGTNPSGGTLAGTATVAASAGVATFANLSIDKVGTGYTLTATGAGSATSTALNLTAGTAATLLFTVQPSTTSAG